MTDNPANPDHKPYTKVDIRWLLPQQDRQAVMDIEKKSFPAPLAPAPLTKKEVRFMLRPDKGNCPGLVACVNDKIVGYAIYDDNEEGVFELIKFAVAPQFRKQHIGEQLMEAVLNKAALAHCPEVTFNVGENNNDAVEFCKKFGFKAIGTERNAYEHSEEDAYRMRYPILHSRNLHDKLTGAVPRLLEHVTGQKFGLHIKDSAEPGTPQEISDYITQQKWNHQNPDAAYKDIFLRTQHDVDNPHIAAAELDKRFNLKGAARASVNTPVAAKGPVIVKYSVMLQNAGAHYLDHDLSPFFTALPATSAGGITNADIKRPGNQHEI